MEGSTPIGVKFSTELTQAVIVIKWFEFLMRALLMYLEGWLKEFSKASLRGSRFLKRNLTLDFKALRFKDC